MLEKGLIKNGNRKKGGKSKKKKNMETDKTCAMSQIKTYVKIIQVTNPLDLHHFIKLKTLCLLAILYITVKALLHYLNVPFKAIVFIFRFF